MMTDSTDDMMTDSTDYMMTDSTDDSLSWSSFPWRAVTSNLLLLCLIAVVLCNNTALCVIQWNIAVIWKLWSHFLTMWWVIYSNRYDILPCNSVGQISPKLVFLFNSQGWQLVQPAGSLVHREVGGGCRRYEGSYLIDTFQNRCLYEKGL